MSKVPHQSFPLRDGGRIVHKSWAVDFGCAHGVGRWSARSESRLLREVREMADHFPRWILTVCAGRNRLTCTKCGGMLVFDRGLRCVVCEQKTSPRRLTKRVELAWFGLLPPIGIDGLSRLKENLIARPPPQHLVGQRDGIGHYLLVPLVAAYPQAFPQSPVKVAYLSSLFSVKGMPREQASHAYHMLSGGFMCLFADGEWRRGMTCREVLQQRAYAHVIKLLRYGAGKRDAFASVS